MAKKLIAQIKLQITGGAANPAPPVGPALGQHGVNIQQFCKEFNDKTQDKKGEVVPVIISVYADRSFDFIMKIAPMAELIKKAIKLAKGSGKPLQEKVGKITKAQIKEIAEKKMPDLNAKDLAGAMKMVEGTAKSLGVTIEG
ncbi:MAG: 50S ribosomal protein L11 [Candidatus Magasanikbacteria bacterium RIFOXYA2_FULL_44_8]|uniref:Large ribosomal subunit protein uL11 n=1 Tax=Candidatus Magasanikbacteria bacterium RIFOXYA2_FULL_44_8 TaxID=1798696 RepID=A0A1F6NLH5_9BACT|nr:MAG: 50S ribosomal protein L11 [Candidatus Magasanikbacteria bacterium RIFOXYA2_FULL_44_8]